MERRAERMFMPARTTIDRRAFLGSVAGIPAGLCISFAAREEATAAVARELSDGFVKPPDAARPWVYWFWINGNITKEGITADLEAMQRVGIGGVLIMEVDGTPQGPIAFGTDPWREMFRFACQEADRLGIVINMNDGAGWTGSGGPWNTPEMSMQRVLYLDLGDVEVMARVKLNGRELGILWKKPFRIDITSGARAGANSLELTVVNLWPNRLIGDANLPEDCEFMVPAGRGGGGGTEPGARAAAAVACSRISRTICSGFWTASRVPRAGLRSASSGFGPRMRHCENRACWAP
jgi:hypothetical protein